MRVRGDARAREGGKKKSLQQSVKNILNSFSPRKPLKTTKLRGTQSVDAHAIIYHFLADLHVTRHAHETK